MITIRNMEEMKKYYVEEVNTYVFEDDVKFLFDVEVNANITANNHIKAWNINAWNITANYIMAWNINADDIYASNINADDIYASNINADNIYASNIKALDISYAAVCFAYKNIECNSIEGRYPNARHFVLDGELIVGLSRIKTA